MQVRRFDAAAAFLEAVRPALAEHEAEHHLVLGVAESLVTTPPPNGGLLGVTIEDDRGLVLAAIMTTHRPLLIASDRSAEDAASAARPMWTAIEDAGFAPSHMIGAVQHVERIMEAWTERTGRSPRVTMHQRVYQLSAVAPIPRVTGSLRVATESDTDFVLDWVTAFEREALAAILPQSPRAVVERRIAAGELFLWCDPDPRTMAGWARPTRRAVAVNGVYTPVAFRGRGYATSCVAELSARMLERGFELCVLYTDLGNPTSNAIYTRIGYRPVQDFTMYEVRV
jgi:predicted GNAT family acetyltransferase